MIALSTLIDSLIEAHTGPRSGASAFRAEGRVQAPGPVMAPERGANDVRLPSRAALERLIASPDADATAQRGGTPAARAAPGTELSHVARLISAVLGEVRGDAGPVRGAAPLWQPTQGQSAGTLATALAKTVDLSGLFYESHLAQFSAGARSLAQLGAEPQARWPSLAAAAADADDAAKHAEQANAKDRAQAPPPAATAVKTGAPSAPGTPGAASTLGTAPAGLDAEALAQANRVQAAYRQGEQAAPARSLIDTGAADQARPAAGAPAAPSPAAALQDASIAPQSVPLVHQQLDLLATSLFRWSGEAWPGVPMQWSIAADEDGANQPDHAADENDDQRRWSTRVSLSLPQLGTLDVRLDLDGDGIQASLVAATPHSAGQLERQSAALAGRLEAAGLRLRQFQVSTQTPGAQA